MEHNSVGNAPYGAKTRPSSNTARKLQVGRPFVKGDDPRRNLNGRPRTFDQARALAQAIAHEELELKDGRRITVAEAVLRSWAKSTEPQLQKAFIEYCFGKVPDKIDTTFETKTKLYLNYAHEERHAGEDRSRISPAISSGTN